VTIRDEAKLALMGSIDKWVNITNRRGRDECYINCPLCELFDEGGDTCMIRGDDDEPISCPCVVDGSDGCSGTPWVKWHQHHQEIHDNHDRRYEIVPGCEECQKLADAELAFLRGLLEKMEAAENAGPKE
jgi:hypothetical protein